MRQLALLVLVVGFALVAPQPADEQAEPAAPCTDDGLAHIPDLPEGVRRPYSVRKRSRTVHRDQVAVTDDTLQLPPGRRRFDAVLPDEQGHDPAPAGSAGAPGQGRRARGQRSQRPSSLNQDAANEVAAPAEPQDADAPARRPGRRPVARPKKVVVVEENYPVNHPAFAEHDAKADAVVDSYESVRRYPTHLPDEDGGDENPSSNDVLGAPAVDQVALEDVPTASTEQREIDNSVPVVVGDSGPELPPGYRSKFPQRTFASDAGGSGDVLRLKPRKRINQYQAPPAPTFEEEEVEEVARQPEVSDEQLQAAPRPRHRPQAAPRRDEQPAEETEAAAVHTGPGAAARGRHRESHRVQIDEGAEPVQRRQPLRRRPVSDEPDAERPGQQRRLQPQQRRPPQQPRRGSTPLPDADEEQQEQQDQQEHAQQEQQSTPPPARRRPRPSRPVPQQRAEVQGGGEQDHAEEPQPRPLRRRPRPRPRPVTAEEVDVGQDLDNALQTTATPPVRRRRPQAAGAGSRTVTEESFQVRGQQPQQERASRGHGRRLDSASSLQGLPQVQVEHDGTAKGHHEPTLVRSAVKKLSEGSHPGDPSPALIQKIVKNTLRRLKPQIAEHEGDVKVDILVKVIQVEDRK